MNISVNGRGVATVVELYASLHTNSGFKGKLKCSCINDERPLDLCRIERHCYGYLVFSLSVNGFCCMLLTFGIFDDFAHSAGGPYKMCMWLWCFLWFSVISVRDIGFIGVDYFHATYMFTLCDNNVVHISTCCDHLYHNCCGNLHNMADNCHNVMKLTSQYGDNAVAILYVLYDKQ